MPSSLTQGTEGLRRIAAGSHALPALRSMSSGPRAFRLVPTRCRWFESGVSPVSRLHCRSCFARETSHRLRCRCAALEVIAHFD